MEILLVQCQSYSQLKVISQRNLGKETLQKPLVVTPTIVASQAKTGNRDVAISIVSTTEAHRAQSSVPVKVLLSGLFRDKTTVRSLGGQCNGGLAPWGDEQSGLVWIFSTTTYVSN